MNLQGRLEFARNSAETTSLPWLVFSTFLTKLQTLWSLLFFLTFKIFKSQSRTVHTKNGISFMLLALSLLFGTFSGRSLCDML